MRTCWEMVVRIDKPEIGQIPELKKLWQEAFGDTLEFIDSFFTAAFKAERCRAITVNGEIAAALYWFDCLFMEKRVAYIYAVATAEKHRGQGYCHRLMDAVHQQLERLGYVGAILVPGSTALFKFYEGMGYRICSQVREGSIVSGSSDIPIRRIEQHEYAELRRKLLPKNSVVQERENLDFLQMQAKFYTGSEFLAAVQEDENKLRFVEFLGDENLMPAVIYTLGYPKAIYRTSGEGRAFAMYLPLSENASLPEYFGLAFD